MFVGGEVITSGSGAAHAIAQTIGGADRAASNVVVESIKLEKNNWQRKDCGHGSETVSRGEGDV